MLTIESRLGQSAALILAMSLAIPAVTQAQAPLQPEIVVRQVRVGDLDLTKPTDLRRLRHRVERAVTHICGVSSQADLLGETLIHNCRRMAARSAEPQIAGRIQHDTEYAAAQSAGPVG